MIIAKTLIILFSDMGKKAKAVSKKLLNAFSRLTFIMMFWNSQGPLMAACETELYLVNGGNPLPFKLPHFIRVFCEESIDGQIASGELDREKIKGKLQAIVSADNIEAFVSAATSKEQVANLHARVRESREQMEIAEGLSKVNLLKFTKGRWNEHAAKYISTLAINIFPFLEEMLNVEPGKYEQVRQFFSKYSRPRLSPLPMSVGKSTDEFPRSVHNPVGSTAKKDTHLEFTQNAHFVITWSKMIRHTHKSLFELFESRVPTEAAQIYEELIGYASANPGTPSFYRFCDYLIQYFDPSYNGNCEHNALATLNWIEVLKSGKRFADLTPEQRLDFTLRVFFSNESLEHDHIEVGEVPNPLQKHLSKSTQSNLKSMLAYLTVSSTNSYKDGLQARRKLSTSLPSHTLRDALNIIYARTGLTVVLGIKILTQHYTSDTPLETRCPLICAEELMVFRVLGSKKLMFSGSLSEHRESLSGEGSIYIQATACDASPVYGVRVFRELAQALSDRNLAKYREVIQNHLDDILLFYAHLYDKEDFGVTSPTSSRPETNHLFGIWTEELRKPCANLPIAIRHMVATVPGGIKRLYFREPGKLDNISPVAKEKPFTTHVSSTNLSPAVRLFDLGSST